MELPTPIAAELYDLSLLGLSWLRLYKPEELTRYGSTVINVLRRTGAISGPTRAKASTNVGLITETMRHMHKLGGRLPQKRDLNELIETRSEHLLVHVPREPFFMPGLFGGRGYGLIITEAGIQYAEQKALSYADHITFDDFMVAWGENARQLGAIHASRRREPVDK